ncbi:transcription elongation protein [Dinoroseobacter phage vB_DshS-R5C]|uniref:Transcription elongation protein n=1 Tax=Dinoroseobacter phage vB_DshS-R5C TaxID=1965368 RepID=A0A1V0DYF5_9CAUD|nr:transcription elongation protein [Dinoroseobacter phage vB_DshS-R5C]ARB06157.1 transcription elongation protein [Dinoroseobacter phage vB_DshS-R5C]
MARKFKTREEWLDAFTREARPIFRKAGFPIPRKVRAAVGFTSRGAKGSRIGECWDHRASEDGYFEIFIDPKIGDPSRIADIHTHELIHAAVGLECGHKGDFVKCMKAVGLVGKPTATTAGVDWHKWADPIIKKLGKLPHAALKAGGNGDKKQSTRMKKCICDTCGFTFRTTAKWMEAAPEMRCPDIFCEGVINFE